MGEVMPKKYWVIMDKNAQDHESKKKITSINDITQLLFDQI